MYLGIDLGTSSVKIILMNDDFDLIAQADAPLKISHPQPLWSEQDPSSWWDATNKTMSTLKQNHVKELAAVKAIGLSGQMHGATLLDANNKVLRPCILWNDGRSMSQCLTLEKTVPDYATITGNRIMPGFTAPKLLWIAEHEPDIFKQVAKVLLPKDYLRFLMSNDFVSDLSDSAGTSWLDVGKREWSETMLAATHLNRKQMPSLVEGSEITGTVTADVAKAWGIPNNTKIVGGAGDNAATAISVNVVKNGKAFLSLGTSGVYFVASDRYKSNPESAVHSFCHCLPNLWHQMTVHLSAASSVIWLANNLKADVETLVSEAENSPPSNDQIIFLPYLSGERTPYNNPYARAVFFGMTHKTQRADLTRAVLEGVAFAFAQGQQAMFDAGIEINDVCVVGGGAQSLYWGKILASALNRPLHYGVNREVGAALGAARLAWLAMNNSALDKLPDVSIEHVIEPDKTLVEEFDQKKKLFADVYANLESVFK